jgi:hypothetical protein
MIAAALGQVKSGMEPLIEGQEPKLSNLRFARNTDVEAISCGCGRHARSVGSRRHLPIRRAVGPDSYRRKSAS